MQQISTLFPAVLALGFAAVTAHAADVPAVFKAPAGGVKVIIAYSSECPISNEYSPTFKSLSSSLPKHAEVVGLSVNYDQTDAELKQHAQEHGLPFPIYCDRNGSLVKRFGVTITPEAVVLDDTGKVCYRGRIDDQFFDRGKRNAHPETHDLIDAVKLALAGNAVAEPWPRAVGCPIPLFPVQVAGPKTYSTDVLPIIQKHCLDCHRKGQVGPFGLETYEQVRKRANDIVSVAADRRMPPWKAVTDFGPAYKHDKSLSVADIKTLALWADAGAPEGNPAEAPAPPKFNDDWKLGTPDVILEAEADFDVPASGGDVYRCFVIPTKFGEHKWVRACEVKAGNRRVVHHVLSYVDISGEARKKDAAEVGLGYECFGGPGIRRVHSSLFGWAPGNEAQFLPDGIGVSLPAGADVVMQVHYHPDGKPAKDRTKLGLYFNKTPVKQSMHNAFAFNPLMQIPVRKNPDDKLTTIPAQFEMPVDVTVLSASPHMHQIGRTMEMSFLKKVDGLDVKVPLVRVDDWDFNWQLTYWFQQPIKVEKGAILNIVAEYDNSASNPLNPNKPPKPMHWGEATTDEMCIGFIGIVKTGQDLTRGDKDDLGEIIEKKFQEMERKFEEEAKKHQEKARKTE